LYAKTAKPCCCKENGLLWSACHTFPQHKNFTVYRLTVSNGLLEVDIYLNHFGTNVPYYLSSEQRLVGVDSSSFCQVKLLVL